MANRTTALTDRLYDYLVDVSVRERPILRELREETAKLPMAMMQIGAEQGQFMGLLVELIGARRAVEVGTFTGYSALCVAEAMGPQGRLIACRSRASGPSPAAAGRPSPTPCRRGGRRP